VTAISKADLDRAIAQVRDEVADVDAEDGPAALANQYRWDLVEGSVFSTRAMDETSLCESIVNDILVAEDLRRGGRVFAFTAETLVRHLAEDEAARVTALLADPTVQSYLERRSDGELRVAPDHMQDAADYCGFYPAWITPLTGETVIYAGTLPPA
jgi:hypothetical protein